MSKHFEPVVLKLQGVSELPGGLVNPQTAKPHMQSVCFSMSRMGS